MSFLLPPQGVLASRKELVKYDQKKMEMGPLITLSEPSTPAATPTMPIQLKVCTQHTVAVTFLLDSPTLQLLFPAVREVHTP